MIFDALCSVVPAPEAFGVAEVSLARFGSPSWVATSKAARGNGEKHRQPETPDGRPA